MAIVWKPVRLSSDTMLALIRVQTSLETAVGNGQLDLPYSELYGVSLDATVAHLCKLYARKAERRRKAAANRGSGTRQDATVPPGMHKTAWPLAIVALEGCVYAPLEGEACAG